MPRFTIRQPFGGCHFLLCAFFINSPFHLAGLSLAGFGSFLSFDLAVSLLRRLHLEHVRGGVASQLPDTNPLEIVSAQLAGAVSAMLQQQLDAIHPRAFGRCWPIPQP
jgi:hypothetical protein